MINVQTVDRIDYKDLGNDWTLVSHVETKITCKITRTVLYNNHKVVWGIGDDGKPEIIHNECPDIQFPTPPSSPTQVEIDRWRAIMSGMLPPDGPNTPPPFPAGFPDGDLPG